MNSALNIPPKTAINKANTQNRRTRRKINTNKGRSATEENRETILNRFYSLMERLGNMIFKRGFFKILKALKSAWRKILQFLDIDTPEKVDNVMKSTRQAAKTATKAAVSALVITLFTSLAEGAKTAIGSFVDRSEEKMSSYSGGSPTYGQGSQNNMFAPSSYQSSNGHQSSSWNSPPTGPTTSQGNFFNEAENPWG